MVLVVSMLAYFTNDRSSSPALVYFSVKICLKITKINKKWQELFHPS